LITPNPSRTDRNAPLYQGYAPGPRGLKKGGAAKRQDGGALPRGSVMDDLNMTAGRRSPPATGGTPGSSPGPGLPSPGLGGGGLGGGGGGMGVNFAGQSVPVPVGAPPMISAGAPVAAPGTGQMPAGIRGSMRRGGAVKKRQDGGVLSAAQRQSLPKSDFALPGKGKGPKGAGSGSYPIPDRSHAQNALARSSGKPVAAQVRAKVKAKYPDMGD